MDRNVTADAWCPTAEDAEREVKRFQGSEKVPK